MSLLILAHLLGLLVRQCRQSCECCLGSGLSLFLGLLVQLCGHRIRRENQSQLRDLPVSRVLEKLTGISPVMEGNQRVFQGHEYKIVVAADDWRFNFLRGGKPGVSGAISAVMQALDLDFKDALRWMAAHFSGGEIERSVRATYEAALQQSVPAAVANPASLVEKMAKYAPGVAAIGHRYVPISLKCAAFVEDGSTLPVAPSPPSK